MLVCLDQLKLFKVSFAYTITNIFINFFYGIIFWRIYSSNAWHLLLRGLLLGRPVVVYNILEYTWHIKWLYFVMAVIFACCKWWLIISLTRSITPCYITEIQTVLYRRCSNLRIWLFPNTFRPKILQIPSARVILKILYHSPNVLCLSHSMYTTCVEAAFEGA